MSSSLRFLLSYPFSSVPPNARVAPGRAKNPERSPHPLDLSPGATLSEHPAGDPCAAYPCSPSSVFDARICCLTHNMMRGQVKDISRVEFPGNLSSRHTHRPYLRDNRSKQIFLRAAVRKKRKETHPFLHGATGIDTSPAVTPLTCGAVPAMGSGW